MSTTTRHRYTPVCVDQALDGLEERLPALPAAGLRLQRSIAAQVQTTAQGVFQASQTSTEIVARVAANAFKTVAGTSRWVTEQTLGTAATAVKTVQGQAVAQADKTISAVRDEGEELLDELADSAEELAETASDALDAAAAELAPDDAPTRDLSHWTKSELYERAQELDIEGRSSMTKDELLSAVTAAS